MERDDSIFHPQPAPPTEEMLNKGPDLVADTQFKWRKLTLEREKIEAVLYAKYKVGAVEKRTAEEIKSLVRADPERYQAVLEEIKAESDYTRQYERLMAAKHLSRLKIGV